jgi:hypothetical protein
MQEKVKPMKKSANKITALTAMLAAGILMFSSLLPKPSAAGTLSAAVIGMFPKEVGEFAYADLKAARKFSWFPQLREQLLPAKFREFEQFLSKAGVDPNTQVEEVAWAGIGSGDEGEQIVGVALGSFSPSATEDRFKQQKMAMVTVKGSHLYSSTGTGAGDIMFFFIDSNTAAFGQRAALEKMIDVRAGQADSLLSNDAIGSLINEGNGKGIIWAVLDQHYTKLGMQQLLPQASDFPQAAAIVNRLKAMVISVQADSGIDAKFQAVCATPDDANTLAAALQAGVLYRKYQAQQSSNPDLASALDSVRIAPAGERLTVDTPVNEDQLKSLLASKTFTVKM